MGKRVRSPLSKRESAIPHFPTLKEHGQVPYKVEGDGACLFRAISYALYGNQERHMKLRKAAIKYMRRHPARFAPFCAPDRPSRRARSQNPHNEAADCEKVFDRYLMQMASPTAWGGQLELQALAKCLRLYIIIHRSDGAPPSKVFGGCESWRVVTICYHVEGEHYWATRKSDQVQPQLRQNSEEGGRPIKMANVRAYPRSAATDVQKEKVSAKSREPIDWAAKMGFAFDEEED